ncbi:hypothetical protein [Mesorhizobium sp. KR2-14]|uniref:hypothetical protein n=1 Tax=Mesorhizobium sp. KR2-14 TaxID=3156610 RepID=UPI0032B457D7
MMNARETFGPLCAYRPLVIGLTGKRHVGKTTAANHLVDAFGFARVHPFDGGKVAAVAYFEHLGAPPDIARRMAFGDLRDQPSPYLPGNALPRLFLEKFGRFMGETMGSDWTLGEEMARSWRATPAQPLVVESVVYEAPAIRAVGGVIIRITRPDHSGPAGVESDGVQAAIDADAEIVNDGDLSVFLAAVGRFTRKTVGR